MIIPAPTPWQLDPEQVAFTFAVLQIFPKGIQSEPPLNYNSLIVTQYMCRSGDSLLHQKRTCTTFQMITSPFGILQSAQLILL